MNFKLISEFSPAGDQPGAIEKLCSHIENKVSSQVLLGVTGSGKTFTIASLAEKINRPILVISHNKTLAAQLYAEFSSLFPYNAVEFFISYYDYYQPEAYLPQTDTYISKDASINDYIDQLRLRATASLLSRRDVIIIASVSCIYNIGSPDLFKQGCVKVKVEDRVTPLQLARELTEVHYTRNDLDTSCGNFRIRGDVMEVYPAYDNKSLWRIEFFGNTVENISRLTYPDYKHLEKVEQVDIFPARHYLISPVNLRAALANIEKELEQRLNYFRKENKLLEAQRLEQRTLADVEMIENFGYCHGIENYSRHLSGREPGARPQCLIDYFPHDFITIIDESHVTIPQLRAMEHGDRSRKQTLIDYGFRLPSALDNRPLKFEEFTEIIRQCVFMSATPGEWEKNLAGRQNIVELIVRPTGLIDPLIEVFPREGQIDLILEEVQKQVDVGKRVLITTLTKKMSEELADYLHQEGVKVTYLHSEIKSIDRVKVLRNLRLGNFDVVVGVNLLREGLDLPEVALVIILDADREGFLRSETSLIQTAGRAARNLCGKVWLFADQITNSMQRAIDETSRRRVKQLAYNRKHNITPASIVKTREQILKATAVAEISDQKQDYLKTDYGDNLTRLEIMEKIVNLQQQMKNAVEQLEFEKAAKCRDMIKELKIKLNQE
ncbi:MAG: excinuclease ABC subunit UvrB [bacterium]